MFNTFLKILKILKLFFTNNIPFLNEPNKEQNKLIFIIIIKINNIIKNKHQIHIQIYLISLSI